MLAEDPTGTESGTIDGRYRIESRLGRGGAGRIYRVLDEHSGERLALKLLIVEAPPRSAGAVVPGSGKPDAALQTMFQHEYHTLVQLAHPHIVRAFDYGQDGAAPYYTMELLEGWDTRSAVQEAGLDLRQICQLLRDLASALALIHSRRMVHRDVSPRNLWCTRELRGKLIDFGTLVSAGSRTRVVGTPPFMPPEALYMQPLDARCDLYALGALAYLLLTRRNAYPARAIGDLPELWRTRPAAPLQLNPELPQALSDLVMALLSQEARGRPASAAEVFERLTALADLPAEDEQHVSRAFLTSPALVGRDRASAQFRTQLLDRRRAASGAVALVAQAGFGRSRMLSSFVLEAKLAGAATLAVDAGSLAAAPFALATTLAEQLLELVPMIAADAVANGSAPLLALLSPALAQALGAPPAAELSPFDRTRKLRSALVALFEIASRARRLVIAVDDVHRADGASLGVLGRLCASAAAHRALLVVSCDAAALAQAPPGLEALVRDENRIELGPLHAADTHELIASLFGAVPGLDEAASWLHELSQGSPQASMQYAQYLVDQGIARHEGGRWRLPRNLREHGLPATLASVLESRIASLDDDARALALGLALARDDSRSSWQQETHVRIEDLQRLLRDGDPPRALAALDALLRAGVVEQRSSFYVLAQRAMADALLRLADAESVRRGHARLADVFEQPGYPRNVLPVRHLQLAGEHERARALFPAANVANGDWDTMRVSVTAECAQQALAHWQAHGGSPREGIDLRRSLLVTCAVYDWSMARFSGAQLAQLRADCGLVHWEQTDPALPAVQRAIECLKRAQEAHDRKPESERGLPAIEAVRELSSCAMVLIGAFVNSHDVANVRTLPALLEPLRGLSPNVAVVAELCALAVERVTGRELGQRLYDLAERLLRSSEVPYVLRVGGGVITMHVQAVEHARRGRARALELVDALAPIVEEDAFFVQHGRWLALAFRGESAAAKPHRKQVEAITEDDVWRRRALLFVEAQLYALTGDAASLEHARDGIAELAARFPGWRPWLHWSTAALHRLRGALGAANDELTAALALAGAGEHRAWVLAAPAHAELLMLRGDPAAAVRAAEEIVQAVRALALDRSAQVAAERVRALAQSRLGDHGAAATSLERAWVAARELEYGGLPLAQLHEAQGRIALAAGDPQRCISALGALWALIERADAPALWNAYEALHGESRAQLGGADLPPVVAEAAQVSSSDAYSQVWTRFSALSERRERAEHALALLLEECKADAGHLLLLDANGLFAASETGVSRASPQLIADAYRLLALDAPAETMMLSEAIEVEQLSAQSARWLHDGGESFAPVLLVDAADGQAVLSGVALLRVRSPVQTQPRNELVQAISRCLRAAGDSAAVTLDG